jgi:hypothetical protein
MSEDDVLFGYRLQLVDLAGRVGVAAACYNFERAHTGRLTRGRVPADIVYGARKMEAR